MKRGKILWLSDISKNDIEFVGGKGANLGEMYNNKFPVPPAFVVTTEAYNYFLEKTKLSPRINEVLKDVLVDNTTDLEKKAKQIRELIINTQLPQDLQDEILEAYDNFNVDLNELKASPDALAIMKSSREPIFVAARSSATAEDLGTASFAGQQDSFINIKGNNELLEKVKRVFASSFTARALFYRKKKGFDANVSVAVVVQKMIDSDKSGVIFSLNPIKHKNILIEAVWGQGEGIVSGKIKPDQYELSRDLEILKENISYKKIAVTRDASGVTKDVQLSEERGKQKVLKTHELKQLGDYALKLENHYKKPQDIEFAIEGESIYILQTRPITTTKGNVGSAQKLDGTVLVSGLPASPGIASGSVKIIHSMDDLGKIEQGDILVTAMTNPDMVITMQKAAAIVTDEGGVTAHAAIVSREMGIPSIVGTDNATSKLEDGMDITVDGYSGNVYLGKAENKSVEILPIVDTKIKIKTIVDIPKFAERAGKTMASGVGLVRIEGIIASQKKHPLWYEKNKKLDDYKNLLKDGLEKIASAFPGKEVWVRTSDIRTDEYSNLDGSPEIEKNPMLGFHGIRFSLKHPEILKAEFIAIKELEIRGFKFGIMFPQIISPDEIKQTKVILEELGMINNPNIKIGAMIETPASVILIDDICKTGIQFISFGTNDLTQYTLAIDRGNSKIQHLYNELDWSILKQISRVIRTCKKYNVETSICGQAGSKKEVVEFLVKQGIDSISVNADVAKDISEFVRQLETDNIDDKKPELSDVTTAEIQQ